MIWNALILAGQREAADPVAVAANVATKALALVGGRTMLKSVHDVLANLDNLSQIAITGDVALLSQHEDFISADSTLWVQSLSSPVLSTLEGLSMLGYQHPALLTTADHALLKAEWVVYFLEQAEATDADMVVALADLGASAKPSSGRRRTTYKFSDSAYAGCNLFAVMTPRAVRLLEFWRHLEQARKTPWRIIAALGFWPAIKFAAGRLSLAEGMALLSKKLKCKVQAVVLPDPLAAVDVDQPADLHLAQKLIEESSSQP